MSKTYIDQKKKNKKLAIILSLSLVGVAAAIAVPLAVVSTQKTNSPTPTPDPTPEPEPEPQPEPQPEPEPEPVPPGPEPEPEPEPPYKGETFEVQDGKLIGFHEGVTKELILERYPDGVITLPDCTSIENDAFNSKIPEEINEIVLPIDVVLVGDRAFANNNISKISFKDNKTIYDWKIETLGLAAFANTKIESFVIPQSLKEIKEGCFKDCVNLNHIDLRFKDVETINFATDTFTNISNNGIVSVNRDSQDYWKQQLLSAGLPADWTVEEFTCLIIKDGICSGIKQDIPQQLQPVVEKELKELTIPNYVNSITCDDGGFVNNQIINKLIIPKSVKTIADGCFKGCSNLKEIDVSGYESVPSWTGTNIFQDCCDSGNVILSENKNHTYWKKLFIDSSGLTIDKDHWIVGDETISLNYCLGFEAINSSTIEFNKNKHEIDLHYSLDNGNSWNEYTQQILLSKGQTIYFKGFNPEWKSTQDQPAKFFITGSVDIKGTVLGLIDDGVEEGSEMVCPYFGQLFKSCTGIRSVDDNLLPSKVLSEGCYKSMFEGCTYLTKMPDLPSMKLAKDCYNNMFRNCDGITEAKVLPATETAENCYYCMFMYCRYMTKGPEIMATNLAKRSLYQMFVYCYRLTYVKIHFTTWDLDKTSQWFESVSSTGEIVVPTNMQNPPMWGTSSILTTWTITRY